MDKKCVSKSEFAEIVGVDRKTVQRAIDRERLNHSVRKVGSRYQIEVEEGVLEWHRNRDPSKDRSGSDSPSAQIDSDIPCFNDSKAMKAFYEANITKIDYQNKAGKLVPVEQKDKEFFAAARLVRDSLFNLPDRISAEIVTLTPEEAHQFLNEEIRKTLENLANSGSSEQAEPEDPETEETEEELP